MFDSTTGEVTAQGEVVAARNQNSDWQRLTQDKRRVAEALEVLPQLAQALRDGKASWSRVDESDRAARCTRDAGAA
jgi:hypothetical protein